MQPRRKTPASSSQPKGKLPRSPCKWRWHALAVTVITSFAGLGWVVWNSKMPFSFWPSAAGNSIPTLAIDHPIEGAVVPWNMPAPVLLWKTNGIQADQWTVGFTAGGRKWRFDGVQPRWRPPAADWLAIKAAAGDAPLELVIAGYEAAHPRRIRAQGSRRFTVSRELVVAPLFFREVNLPFKDAVKDPSQIRWRFGAVDQDNPPIVLEKLPVCGNCHSFSRHGEYLAMDVDYGNNKGSYVIAKTAAEMKLETRDIITWDDYRRDDGEKTLGLLSQISPNGRFVLSTVKDLSVFMPRPDLAFSQLFFPVRGILAVYDRAAKRFFSLPGADDPEFVQSNPVWSPDGEWIVFARARASKLKRPAGADGLLFTGEEAEAVFREMKEFRYDLYRLPFHEGRGGKAEPLRGAAMNGRSNYFPKFSPDGRWIIFCQAANYMLLQPDSEMFIVPAEGGDARRLDCNLSRMNSWHSWSPDGRWIVFSSKAHSDFTQLYLARISPQGQASPPVWLAHLVEPGRAANIPEFVPLPPGGITRIRQQFLDDLFYVTAGEELVQAGEWERAAESLQKALSLNATNFRAHLQLGQLLLYHPKPGTEAMDHLQTAVRLRPQDPLANLDLGLLLSHQGDERSAIAHFEQGMQGLKVNDDSMVRTEEQKNSLTQGLHLQLGCSYQRMGNLGPAEAHFREALRLKPEEGLLHYYLGALLLDNRKLAEAEPYLAKAIQLRPDLASARNSMGILLHQQNHHAEAMASFQKAIQLDPGYWQARFNLAKAYLAENHFDQAIPELREILRLQPAFKPAQEALDLAVGKASSTAR
jgi:tetratricopeptide (TPR) repeat protein